MAKKKYIYKMYKSVNKETSRGMAIQKINIELGRQYSDRSEILYEGARWIKVAQNCVQ
jgi:hypothetical protein